MLKNTVIAQVSELMCIRRHTVEDWHQRYEAGKIKANAGKVSYCKK